MPHPRTAALRALPLAAITVVAAMLSTPASAAELVLTDAPDSNWVVDNGEEACRLVRALGEGRDSVTLAISQWGPGQAFSLTVTGRPLRRFDERTIMLAFGDADGPLGRRPGRFMEGKLGDNDDVLVASTALLTRPPQGKEEEERAAALAGDPQSPYGTAAPMLPPAAIAMVDRIELSQGIDTLRLQPTRLSDALGVLDACSQSRLPEWGLDPAAHRTMTKGPELLNGSAMARQTAENYPVGASLRGEQANLQMRVVVDETGAVADCTIFAASRPGRVSTDACDHFRQGAQYLPALDAAGKPMKSFHMTMILFRMMP